MEHKSKTFDRSQSIEHDKQSDANRVCQHRFAASTTIYGPTVRRVWASTSAVVALAGVVLGGLALGRPAGPFGTGSGRLRVNLALVAGLIAGVNGGLVVALAEGGPGSGNGVVGGAAALVLGLIAVAFGGLALARTGR